MGSHAARRYGPQASCERSACAGLEPHVGGVHLDQRHPLYDGPEDLLTVLPLAVRDSARRLVREAPNLMAETVDLAQHIERLRDQVAAVRVDMDRQVRAALASASNCQAHGKQIDQLNGQADHFHRQGERSDAARVVLLGLLHTVEEMVDAHRAGSFRADVTVADLVGVLERVAKRASAAHDREWRKADKPARKTSRSAAAQPDLWAGLIAEAGA